MKAVIIAGGRGERLKPITDNIPKPMVEVNGKPILLHIINLFKKNGITEFIFALCYLPEVITSYFGNGEKFGVKIQYTYEDIKKPLGTAGAITLVKKFITGTFIVTYADILRELDVKKMIAFHKKKKAFATLNVYKRESQDAKSRIIIDQNNKIIKFIERPQEKYLRSDTIWVNGSFYVFEPEIYKFIPAKQKTDFGADVFPKLIRRRRILYSYPSRGYFIDIGNLQKLELARKTLKGKILI